MKYLITLTLLVSQLMAFSLFDNSKEINKQNLTLVHDIKNIIITTQKTRGLTNSYMNGNVVAQLLVYNQREEMTKNIKAIGDDLSKIDNSKKFSKEADAIIKSVKKLNKRAFRMPSGEVFATYTHYIEQWMALNSKIIDAQFKDAKTHSALVLLNGTVLPLTENIGKMRGMGSGIVARGTCKDIETPKMQAFASEIVRYKEDMMGYLKKHTYAALTKSDLRTINKNIVDYTKLTTSKVIGQEKIDLDANNFFDQGTGCIKDVLKVYKVVADTLD